MDQLETVRETRGSIDHGEILAALADPTRRQLLDLLSDQPRSASDLARHIDISRQAIAKHLGALEAVALVAGDRVGRELVFDVRPDGLAPLADWVSTTSEAWERRLDRTQDVLDAE